jgi:ABC-type multidrug transport system ATPase subunit
VSVPSAVVLEAKQARIDVDGAVQCDRLSLQVSGRRIVIAGPAAWAITSALGCRAHVASGLLTLDGRDVSQGQHIGYVGVAPWDMTLAPGVTVLEWVTASFGLSGLGRRDAASMAQRTLETLGIGPLGPRRTSSLRAEERRAVVIAQAMLPNAPVLCVETPLASLESHAAQAVVTLLGLAAQQKAIIASVSRCDSSTPEHDLLLGADHVAILSSHELVWAGSPEQMMQMQGALSLVVHGNSERLIELLTAGGVQVTAVGQRLRVLLPQGVSSSFIGKAAAEAGAVVVEMVTLVGSCEPKADP